MSRPTKSHYVRVVDVPGQPARLYPALNLTAATIVARRLFATGHKGAVVEVYEGKTTDNVDRDPVKVFS